MNRFTFLKSFLTLIVAPKVIKDINSSLPINQEILCDMKNGEIHQMLKRERTLKCYQKLKYLLKRESPVGSYIDLRKYGANHKKTINE